MLRSLERIVWGVVAALAVTLALLYWAGQTAERNAAAPFDAAAWRADDAGCAFIGTSVRQRMAGDLRARLLGPPLTRAQVRGLLGDPDVAGDAGRWSYSAGTSTMDCVTFDVVFDAAGVVREAGLVQH